jgi:NADH-quinone oxidoreductase subunit H
MAWLRWLAPVLLAVGVAWLVAGGGACARDASPQLVQVLDVAPREVEAGDHLAIVGQGFPPGKAARVTFRGTLRRPGERAEHGAEIEAQGAVTGPEQVQLAFSETTQALFCGAADRAVHTTFDGEVEVAFAAAVPGAPPVAGVLRHVTLDVHPSGAASGAERDREGARALAWLGLKATPGATGLSVEAVGAGSRAEAAGLAAGDVLTSFDGLRITSMGDVVPAPGAREAVVGVRHGASAVESLKTVSVEGFRQAPPTELLAATLIVLAALAAVLFFAAPSRPALAASVQRVILRLRASAAVERGARTSPAKRLARALASAAREALPPAGAPAVVDVLVCALLAAMPLGQYLVAARLDVGLLFVGAATALVVVALVARGATWRGLTAAAHVAWQHVPASVAVAAVVFETGSLRVQEIERAQGGWPWDWLAFRSPASLAACLLLLACARIEPDVPPPASALAARVEELDGRGPSPRGTWLDAARRAHRLVVAGLASALFLGGWLLPGVSPAVQNARPALEAAGCAWLLLKMWGLVTLLAWGRQALPRRTAVERSRRAALWQAPVSLGVLAATVAWAWWSPPGPAQTLVSGALVALAGLAVLAMAHRVRAGLAAPPSEGRLSPFL